MHLERFTDVKGDVFIKFPILNNLLNERGWRANPDANERYVYTAIGKPLSLMFDKEESLFRDYHPFDPSADLTNSAAHVAFARKYQIGEIVDITKESGSYKAASGEIPWFGIAKITDPVVANEFRNTVTKLVPPAFSPGIIQYAGADDNITEYEIVHVAAVPSGAFGPKFVTVGKCQGDITTCTPRLRAASNPSLPYRERTGCCPLTAFSSLLTKSASSTNSMSYNTNAGPPSPGFVPSQSGTATVRNPVGDTMATQQTGKPKPTIRIKRLNFSQSQSTEPQPNGENPEGGEGNGENNGGETDASMTSKATVQSVQKELADLRKQYQTQASAWKQDTMKREIADAIPKSLFTDKNGTRFRQKEWEKEVEARLQQGLPIETIREIYQLKMQMLEVPEIKRASSAFLGEIPRYQSASSLESDEERIRAEKALRLNGGI